MFVEQKWLVGVDLFFWLSMMTKNASEKMYWDSN